jgi:hypothetical protein
MSVELAPLREPGSSRRITVMRYPTRVYQSDHRRVLLGRSDHDVNSRAWLASASGARGKKTDENA